MNRELATIRMELDINAQRILSEYRTHNENLEEQVEAGINKALSEILEGDFVNYVAAVTKDALGSSIRNSVTEWQMKMKIQKAITNAIEAKVDKIASEWADKALKNLEDENN